MAQKCHGNFNLLKAISIEIALTLLGPPYKSGHYKMKSIIRGMSSLETKTLSLKIPVYFTNRLSFGP